MEEVENRIKERQEEIAEEIASNFFWDDMELIVYNDWSTAIRQLNSFEEGDDLIIRIIDLSESYWTDILADWGIEEWDSAGIRTKKQFFYNVLLPIVEGEEE